MWITVTLTVYLVSQLSIEEHTLNWCNVSDLQAAFLAKQMHEQKKFRW